MEKRKIQRTGGSSFSITLPKKWAEANDLKEQDAVVLSFLGNGALIIRSLSNVEKQMKVKLNITGLNNEEIKREIIAFYIGGAEEIKIFAKSLLQEQRLTTREILRLLIGFEIIDETTNVLLIKNILSSQKFSFMQGIEKMFFMAQSMFQDAIVALLEYKKALAKDVIERDTEIDKLYFLILRYNNALLLGRVSEKELGLTAEQSHYYENVATQLERIADHAVKIASVVESNKIFAKEKLKKTLKSVSSHLLELLSETSQLVRNHPKTKKVHKITNKIMKAEKETGLFQKEAAKSDFSEVLIVSDSIDRLQGYMLNIAEATIDQTLMSKKGDNGA